MDTQQEIKKLIAEYVKKLEDKEGELTAFKKEIEAIISTSKEDLAKATTDLDLRFNNNEISEDEYLSLFRDQKQSILLATKGKLDALVKNLNTD